MRTAVYVGTSLDGFIAREDGSIDWLVEFDSPDVTEGFEKFISRIDAVVMGRRTFEQVLTFPEWLYTRHVYVLSRSMKGVPEKASDKASILSVKPREVLDQLSRLGHSSLYIDGGSVIKSFLREDLVDELTVTTVPVLIGSGISLFGSLAKDMRFNHVRTVTHSRGLVESVYERDRTVA